MNPASLVSLDHQAEISQSTLVLKHSFTEKSKGLKLPTSSIEYFRSEVLPVRSWYKDYRRLLSSSNRPIGPHDTHCKLDSLRLSLSPDVSNVAQGAGASLHCGCGRSRGSSNKTRGILFTVSFGRLLSVLESRDQIPAVGYSKTSG